MYQNNHSEMYDCHQSISDVKVHNRKRCHIQILAGSMTLPALSCWIGRLCSDILKNFTEKWPSNVWKYKCRKRDEELMTLEMLVFFSSAYLRVLNGLQKASAQHEPSGMQIPFPDVKLHINWLFTFFFLFLIKRSSMSMWKRG